MANEWLDDKGIYPKYLVFKHPDFEPAGFKAEAWEFSEQYSSEVFLDPVEDFCFVLKPIKDKHARLALSVYAESVRKEKPRLAKELREILDDFDGE